jgi:hypothetical protein
VSAHAVRDDEQPSLVIRFGEEAVFVASADHAHIRAGGDV